MSSLLDLFGFRQAVLAAGSAVLVRARPEILVHGSLQAAGPRAGLRCAVRPGTGQLHSVHPAGGPCAPPVGRPFGSQALARGGRAANAPEVRMV